MTQRVLLLASHGIAEYDDVRMFHHLGYDVFCPGGYANPAQPGETLRPALPQVPYHHELAAMCDEQRANRPDPGRYIDWAKANLHPGLIDWADVIIVHHFVREWIKEQWPRIRHKRVVWRTCGQSDDHLERDMAPLHADGLQIVRYSPAERRYFESVGAFAGEDALIRFGKFADDYGPWIPEGTVQFRAPNPWTRDDRGMPVGPFIANVTQNMAERGEATGLSFYLRATDGLPARPAGPGSRKLPGGVGELPYSEMREYLRRARAYLYVGTTPASYTLGLIEAMLSGVPVVSIGPKAWAAPDLLFEAHRLIPQSATSKRWDGPDGRRWNDDPEMVRRLLGSILEWNHIAIEDSAIVRQRAVELFGMDTVGPQWRAFLQPDTTPWAPKVEPDRLATPA